MLKLLFATMLPLMALCSCAIGKEPRTGDSPVTLYRMDGGRSIAVADTAAVFSQVVELVQSSDDKLKLVVTSGGIADVKRTKTCLEIVFPQPRTVRMSDGKDIQLQRVLIELSGAGRGSAPVSVIMYLGRNTYFTPPYVSHHGQPQLNRLLHLLGLDK